MCIRDRGDELELQSYSERLLFAKRRLGLEKSRALAQAASSDAPIGKDVGALESEPADAHPEPQQLQAAFA
eukprot:13057324-Alexandrium_andersonii.AAC.1